MRDRRGFFERLVMLLPLFVSTLIGSLLLGLAKALKWSMVSWFILTPVFVLLFVLEAPFIILGIIGATLTWLFAGTKNVPPEVVADLERDGWIRA